MAALASHEDSVAKAFEGAFHAAVDGAQQATLAQLFTDASTMSFEGSTVKGRAAIVQKLCGLGLPPSGVTRRSTGLIAAPSCCGSGAIVVFCTGEWMNQQFQEVFHLVPQGAGSYYVHNMVFRLGMSNPWNVPGEAQDLAKGFLQHYYSKYDGGEQGRMALAPLYTASSTASFERERFVGQQKIMEKLLSLPPVHHDPNMAVDVQLIAGLDIVLIFLLGQQVIDGGNPLKFAQVFIIQKAVQSYVVGNQLFLLNYG